MNDTREFLLDLQAEITRIEQFSAEGETAFFADERTQYAIMMAYARIGEIAKRLPQAILDTRPEAEWRDIKGFRDVLLHRYDEINPRRVWQAVQKVPVLRAAVEALLVSLPPNEDEASDS
ncbi:MAG: DUF86 domain-containing protein [Anaerolineae bacterium]|nr:DUF86 domain-containing protein [Anaerolineae bacterium]MCA9908681.1 DUF86 domain-containing protein [Anaerolineae bacterium]